VLQGTPQLRKHPVYYYNTLFYNRSALHLFTVHCYLVQKKNRLQEEFSKFNYSVQTFRSAISEQLHS
jgi:hypothetical protein